MKIYSDIYNEDFKVFDNSQGTRIHVFDNIYVSDTVSGSYVMQGSSNMGTIGLVSIKCFERGMDLDHNLGIQRFSHLGVPVKCQWLIGIAILMLTG